MATATCRLPRGLIGEVRRLEQRRQVPGEVLSLATSLPREAAITLRTVSSLCSVQLRADLIENLILQGSKIRSFPRRRRLPGLIAAGEG